MLKIKLLLLLSIIILFAGCATQDNYSTAVNSWRGASQESVYRAWGYPDKIETLPNRHKLLVYRDVVRGQHPIYSTPQTTSVVTSPSGVTQINTTSATLSGGGSYFLECTTWFELDDSGNVYSVSFRGDNCVATRSFMLAHSYDNMPTFGKEMK
jgi:hypothetical protein